MRAELDEFVNVKDAIAVRSENTAHAVVSVTPMTAMLT